MCSPWVFRIIKGYETEKLWAGVKINVSHAALCQCKVLKHLKVCGFRKGMMIKMIKCRECGAQIEELSPRCPYCGVINELGAEHKYMQDMSDLKDDLEELADIPKEEIAEEVKGHLKFTVKTVMITLLILAVLAGILFLLDHSWEISESIYEAIHHIRTADAREQLLWEQENFPQLDEWYEAEDFDAILEFQYEVYNVERGIRYNLYNWEHSQLITLYDLYHCCMELQECIQNGDEPYLYEFQSAFYKGVNLVYSVDLPYQRDSMDDHDRELAAGWKAEVMDFLKQIYGVDETKLQEVIQQADQGGYLEYTELYDYVEQIQDRLSTAD